MMHQMGLYEPGDSWLYRLDPRPRLLWAVSSLLLTLIASDEAIPLGLLIITHLLLLAGGVRVRRLLRFWWTLVPLIMAILILQPVVTGAIGDPLLLIGDLVITSEGVQQAITYAIKLSGAAFAVFFPLVTTPIHLLIQSLTAWGLPYRAGLMLGISLHHLGLLGGLYSEIMEAQQARGLDLSKHGFFRRVRAFFPTLIALIIASLRSTESLALSLSARGYGLIGAGRTAWAPLTLQKKDWLLMAANLMLIAGILLIVIL